MSKIDIVVRETTERLFKQIVSGKFRIGYEPVIEFVKFAIILEYLQTEVHGQSQSLLEIFKEIYGNAAENSVDEEDEYRTKYDKFVYSYHKLNREKEDDYNTIQKEEEDIRKKRVEIKGDTTRQEPSSLNGNIMRFKGNRISKYQKGEFRILAHLKSTDEDNGNLRKTYKRLLSKTGTFSKITFTDYKQFVEKLSEDIKVNRLYLFKNVQYYKLEKRLGFELMKAVLRSVRICQDNGENPEEVLSSLSYLNNLPLINDRQKYADVFPSLNKIERERWRIEVEGLQRFIGYVYTDSKERIQELPKEEIFTEKMIAEFQSIYADQLFKNDYKLRKDFNSNHFKITLEFFDQINQHKRELVWFDDVELNKQASQKYVIDIINKKNKKLVELHESNLLRNEVNKINVSDQTKKNILNLIADW